MRTFSNGDPTNYRRELIGDELWESEKYKRERKARYEASRFVQWRRRNENLVLVVAVGILSSPFVYAAVSAVHWISR